MIGNQKNSRQEKQSEKLMRDEIYSYWPYILFSFCFSLLLHLIGLISPMIMKNILDIYIPNRDLENTYISILFLVGIPAIV